MRPGPRNQGLGLCPPAPRLAGWPLPRGAKERGAGQCGQPWEGQGARQDSGRPGPGAAGGLGQWGRRLRGHSLRSTAVASQPRGQAWPARLRAGAQTCVWERCDLWRSPGWWGRRASVLGHFPVSRAPGQQGGEPSPPLPQPAHTQDPCQLTPPASALPGHPAWCMRLSPWQQRHAGRGPGQALASRAHGLDVPCWGSFPCGPRGACPGRWAVGPSTSPGPATPQHPKKGVVS